MNHQNVFENLDDSYTAELIKNSSDEEFTEKNNTDFNQVRIII